MRPKLKTPAQYRLLLCVCENTPHPQLLCYSPHRGYFEPITNAEALPVTGRILSWTYADAE